jgi:hypothetical protein
MLDARVPRYPIESPEEVATGLLPTSILKFLNYCTSLLVSRNTRNCAIAFVAVVVKLGFSQTINAC